MQIAFTDKKKYFYLSPNKNCILISRICHLFLERFDANKRILLNEEANPPKYILNLFLERFAPKRAPRGSS